MKTNRVLLKLSGEALAGPKKTGFDEDTVREVARQVKMSVEAGVQVGIVIGGGNFWRGRTSNAIDRTKADQIGTVSYTHLHEKWLNLKPGYTDQLVQDMNCILASHNSPARVLNPERTQWYSLNLSIVKIENGE